MYIKELENVNLKHVEFCYQTEQLVYLSAWKVVFEAGNPRKLRFRTFPTSKNNFSSTPVNWLFGLTTEFKLFQTHILAVLKYNMSTSLVRV